MPLAAEQAEWTYRIEDFDQVWPEIRTKLDLKEVDLSKISRETGSKNPDPVTWEDIEKLDRTLAYRLRRLAEQYEYE